MITFANAEDSPQNVNIDAYDANSGKYIKTLIVPMSANTSTGFWEGDFEKLLDWSPSATQFHLTLVFGVSGKRFTGNVSNEIANLNLLTYVNMSQVCPTW